MVARIVSYALPFLLAGLMLVQSATLSLIQLDFMWNREAITEMFCINLDKPQMNCHGSCELGRRLEKASNTELPQDLRIPEFVSWVFVFSPIYAFHAAFLSKSADQIDHAYLEPGQSRFPTGGIFHPPQS